tara:strand:+ start:15770 stop:16093 length:324 start_codon:yes stop_codon:yes gene_type:complete
MNVPNFCKPIYWPLVGGIARNFYESPAENGCFALVLLVFSVLWWISASTITGSMILGLFWTAPILLWSLGHFVACIVMIARIEIEKARREAERREAAARKAVQRSAL